MFEAGLLTTDRITFLNGLAFCLNAGSRKRADHESLPPAPGAPGVPSFTVVPSFTDVPSLTGVPVAETTALPQAVLPFAMAVPLPGGVVGLPLQAPSQALSQAPVPPPLLTLPYAAVPTVPALVPTLPHAPVPAPVLAPVVSETRVVAACGSRAASPGLFTVDEWIDPHAFGLDGYMMPAARPLPGAVSRAGSAMGTPQAMAFLVDEMASRIASRVSERNEHSRELESDKVVGMLSEMRDEQRSTHNEQRSARASLGARLDRSDEVVNATHATVNATHATVNATHATVNATHQVVNANAARLVAVRDQLEEMADSDLDRQEVSCTHPLARPLLSLL